MGERELDKHEVWLVNALERLKEIFIRHEKVQFHYTLLSKSRVQGCNQV